MQPLDYETSGTEKPRRIDWLFWVVFASSYLLGLLLLDVADDLIQMRITGHHNDGGIVGVSLFVSPAFAALAKLIKSFWKRCEGVGFAILFSIFAPLLTYLFSVELSILL
jgi:hypothetical protein